MLASYAFKPMTSICSKKAAVAFIFVGPLYKGSVGVVYRVFQVAAFYIFTVFFYVFSI